MSEFIPRTLSRLTRFPIIALPYDRRNEAVPRELIIDYDTGGAFVLDDNGNIMPLSKSVNINSVYIMNDNSDIISLETYINSIVANILQVEEVDELAIFRIPSEAQFDLKSVTLHNNKVQIYNFHQAPADSIPIATAEANNIIRVNWVPKETLFAEAGLGQSAEGSFDILNANIIVTIYGSVEITNASDNNANGIYDSTANNHVWTKTVNDNTYIATYTPGTNSWSLKLGDTDLTGTVTADRADNEVRLVPNKKQVTVIPNTIDTLNVFLPSEAAIGDLAYSRVIWLVDSTGQVPNSLFSFKKLVGNNSVDGNNIIWERATDYQPAENSFNFYYFDTWNGGQTWFGKRVVMGRESFEVTIGYLNDNYYTIPQIDGFTSWDID